MNETQKFNFDKLRQEISDYSEDSYCAGWLDGVEFTLLQWLLDRRAGIYNENGKFGLESKPSPEMLDHLERLSTDAGGVWPVWKDTGSDWCKSMECGPVPLPLDEAIAEMTAWNKKWAAYKDKWSKPIGGDPIL